MTRFILEEKEKKTVFSVFITIHQISLDVKSGINNVVMSPTYIQGDPRYIEMLTYKEEAMIVLNNKKFCQKLSLNIIYE